MFEIGTSLREARLRRRIDIVEAEQDTKIRSKYLAALESEEFDILPGAVYTRGFLRTYATYLGLDPQLFIDEYNSRFGRFEDENEHVAARRIRRDERTSRTPRFRTVAIACLLIGAVAAWYGLRSQERQDARNEKVLQASQSAAGTDRSSETPSLADVTKKQTPTRAASTKNSSGTATPAGTTTSPPVQSPTEVAKLTVATPRGASWVQVRSGSINGKVLYGGTMQAGQKRTFSAPRLHVTIGFPSAVLLTLPKAQLAPDTSATASYVVTPTKITPA